MEGSPHLLIKFQTEFGILLLCAENFYFFIKIAEAV